MGEEYKKITVRELRKAGFNEEIIEKLKQRKKDYNKKRWPKKFDKLPEWKQEEEGTIKNIFKNLDIYSNESVHSKFLRGQLENVVKDPRWNNLESRYAHPEGLLPQDLTINQLNAIITELANPYIFSFIRSGERIPEMQIPGVGVISEVSQNELTRTLTLAIPGGENNRKMRLVVEKDYNDSPFVAIPEDPHFVLISPDSSPNHIDSLFLCSDLTTFLIVPVDVLKTTPVGNILGVNRYTVYLQEYAENIPPSMLYDESDPEYLDYQVNETKKRMLNALGQKGLALVNDTDLENPDNFILPRSDIDDVAIINILARRRII